MKTLILSLSLIAAACSNEHKLSERSEVEDLQQTAEQPAKVFLIGRVSDHADILDPSQEVALTARLESLEERTQHQMVVVSVNSLDGEDIADFTRNLANSWGIGRAGQDDGGLCCKDRPRASEIRRFMAIKRPWPGVGLVIPWPRSGLMVQCRKLARQDAPRP